MLKPSVMLKTRKGYQYDAPPETTSLEYKISNNDLVEFRLFSNDGFKLIDLTTINAQGNASFAQNRNVIPYLVEFDGNVKLPILGRIHIAGMTIREAERLLEDKYSEFYNKPFVMLNVSNRRVIVFTGSGGQAKVINLNNENTTLIEALALSGGITNSGKAHKIKLIRGNPKDPEVYLIDLSTIEGIEQGAIVLQANDIIYVDPVFAFTREVLAEITPIVALITSVITIITFTAYLNK